MRLKRIACSCLMLLMLMLGACEKAPLNSDIEGHWQLEQFTVLATNEVVPCRYLYYGITRMVTEVARKAGDKENVSFVARTSYGESETVLILSNFKVNGYNTDLGVNATASQLKPFGIVNPEKTSFKVLKVSQKQLVLESDYARLQLRKF